MLSSVRSVLDWQHSCCGADVDGIHASFAGVCSECC